MAFEGMDPEQIKALAGRFETQAHTLDATQAAIGQLIDRAESSWKGDAASRFAALRRSTYGPQLTRASRDVQTLATTARQNAADQDKASGDIGTLSGSGSTHHGGFFSGLVGGVESGFSSALKFQIGWDKDVIGGAVDSVEGIGKFAWDFSTIRAFTDPEGYAKSVVGLGKGLETAVTNPVGFGEALIDWKDIKDGHPGRAVGELLPTIALTLVSGGAGAAAKGADAAATLDRTGAAVEALQRTGSVFPELTDTETAAKVTAAGIDPDTAAGAAAKFQAGQPYGGIDPWINGSKLNPGDLIAMGRGGKLSGFAIDPATARAADPGDVWRMLQVAPRRIPADGLPYSAGAPGDRSALDVYRYDGPPIDKAESPTTLENPQFGSGGLPQQFIPHAQELYENGQLVKVDEILTPGGKIRIEDPAFAHVNPDLPSNPLTVHGAKISGGLQGGAVGAGAGVVTRVNRRAN